MILILMLSDAEVFMRAQQNMTPNPNNCCMYFPKNCLGIRGISRVRTYFSIRGHNIDAEEKSVQMHA